MHMHVPVHTAIHTVALASTNLELVPLLLS